MSKFSEYARSAAFRIELSGPMVRELLNLRIGEVVGSFAEGRMTIDSYYALERRGLVEWRVDAGGNKKMLCYRSGRSGCSAAFAGGL